MRRTILFRSRRGTARLASTLAGGLAFKVVKEFEGEFDKLAVLAPFAPGIGRMIQQAGDFPKEMLIVRVSAR